ncbi:hypothetical protein Tco_1119597 [Tanacetum coccineum]
MSSPLPPSILPSPIRPLRNRAAMVQIRAATPSTHHSLLLSGTPPLLPIPFPSSSISIPPVDRREIISEADMQPCKRLLLTAPTPRFKIGESSTAVARQLGSSVAYRADYSLMDTQDANIRAVEEKAMYDVRVVNLRVNYQADVCRRESEEFYTRHQDAQDDRAAVRAEIEVLRIERLAYERER